MGEIEISGWSNDVIRKGVAAFEALGKRYRDDPAFRAELDLDPGPQLRGLGFQFPPDVQVRVVADTNDLMHLVMPADPNVELSDEALDVVAGGNSAGTVLCALCSSLPSSASTLSSASST